MKEFTVKEIADLLEVSKTTVQKYIKKAGLSYDHISKNKQFYSYDKARKIIKDIKPDYNLAAFDLENEVENSKAETANSKENTENSKENTENSKAETANSAAADRMLDMLQEEIVKKDQMIKDLQDKLDKAYEKIADMADKVQYITAADKTAQIIDMQQQSQDKQQQSQGEDQRPGPAATGIPYPEPVEDKPKGFFARLFGGRK